MLPTVSCFCISNIYKHLFCRFTYDSVRNANMGQPTRIKRSATSLHSPCIRPFPFSTSAQGKRTTTNKPKWIWTLQIQSKGWLTSGLAYQRPGSKQMLSFSSVSSHTAQMELRREIFPALLQINGCCVYILHTEHCPPEAKGCILPTLNFRTIWR